MIFLVALLSAISLFFAALGSQESCYLSEEQEDECASVCYPIVKPLLRYFEKAHQKDDQFSKCKRDFSELQKLYSDLQSEDLKHYAQQVSKWQQDYSEVQNKYTEVLSRLKDTEVKYALLHSKHLEVDNLKALINQKNNEIVLLKDHIRELKEKSELATLTIQFRDVISKLGTIVKIGGMDENNLTKSNTKTEIVEIKTGNINIETTPKTEAIDFPDPCTRTEKRHDVLREIQLPGLEPFKVVCNSYSDFGSKWLVVYRKQADSHKLNGTYEDYEHGFGDVGTKWNDEFFIGLNRLHILTSGKPHEVRVHTHEGVRICQNFVVGDRSDGYKVKSIGNCIGNHRRIPKQDVKFSTFDRDEDGVGTRNYAKEMGYGWWFDYGKSPRHGSIYMYIRRTG